MKAPSQRQLRVGELIRHILAEMLMRGEVHDADLDGVSVTVSEVRVSPDLRQATAYVAPLGGGDPSRVIAALERRQKFIRGQVGRQMTTKNTPHLRFRPDTTFDEASHIEELLHQPRVQADLHRDDEEDR